MAQVKADLSVTLFITVLVKRLLNRANIIDPNAPTAAASVGVATPAKIEPRTHIIRNWAKSKDFENFYNLMKLNEKKTYNSHSKFTTNK